MSGALCFQIPSSLALLSTASSTTLTSLLSQATAIDSRAESRFHPYTLPKKPKEVTKKTQTDIYTADHVRGIEADLFSGTRQSTKSAPNDTAQGKLTLNFPKAPTNHPSSPSRFAVGFHNPTGQVYLT